MQDSASVENLRARARRRLIGAAVLVVVAVVALPMVFESRPRPLDPNIAIELTRGAAGTDATHPGAATAPASARVRSGDVEDSSSPVSPPVAATASNGSAAATSGAPAAANVAAAKVESESDDARAEKVQAEKERAERERAARAAAEKAASERAAAKAAADKAAGRKAEAPSRFLIQVGAFAEAGTVRETRQRIERLGLRSIEQEIETANGRRTRVRLGPFDSREDAEKALARLRAAGLPGTVLAL